MLMRWVPKVPKPNESQTKARQTTGQIPPPFQSPFFKHRQSLFSSLSSFGKCRTQGRSNALKLISEVSPCGTLNAIILPKPRHSSDPQLSSSPARPLLCLLIANTKSHSPGSHLTTLLLNLLFKMVSLIFTIQD